MATIYNSELSKEIQEGAKIQSLDENIPNQLDKLVIPVMEVNPKLLKSSTVLNNTTRTTTGSGITLLAAQPNKEVFISGIMVANVQDVVSDNASITITVVINGANRNIYKFLKPTLTISNTFHTINFVPALKIDRNTAITFTASFTAGSCTTEFSIFGYFIENPNA